jgi:hypothetical protein
MWLDQTAVPSKNRLHSTFCLLQNYATGREKILTSLLLEQDYKNIKDI